MCSPIKQSTPASARRLTDEQRYFAEVLGQILAEAWLKSQAERPRGPAQQPDEISSRPTHRNSQDG